MSHIAYVDGSRMNGRVGFGAVILKDEKILAELSGPVEEQDMCSMGQVGGELQAVYATLEWCSKQKVKQVTIIYDYLGIEKWPTKGWKAKKTSTQAYAAYVNNSGINITWKKVKAHSGDKWNDHADELAKAGTGGSAAPPPAASGRMDTIERQAFRLIEELAKEGIAAENTGTFNDQYIRIKVSSGGLFDIYNTAKRNPSNPYIHNFNNKTIKEKIQSLWLQILNQS